MRDRSCAVVLHDGAILMVQHVEAGPRTYWTLPGGGIEDGESAAQAAVRELREETGLHLSVTRFLCSIKSASGSTSHCFLMNTFLMDTTVTGRAREVSALRELAVLGFDPEESEIAAEDRTLQGLAWRPWALVRDDVQVCRVAPALTDVERRHFLIGD